MNRRNSPRLVCIDLDGTLIRGTTSSQHLANLLGHAESLKSLEERYARNEISNQIVAEGSAFHFKGRRTDEIAAFMRSVPLIGEIDAALGELLDRRVPMVLATVTWRFAAAPIASRFGFVDWSGTEMSVDDDGVLSGVVSRHFDEFDKREFVARFCSLHGIAASEVVAIGDSRSDIPLFGWVGHSIALNASDAAKAAAKVTIETDDLRDVVRLLWT